MGRCFRLVLVFSAVLSTAVFSNDLSGLFEEHFRKHYKESSCGDNILRFARAAKALLGKADSLLVVVIANKGNSVFGLVNAEVARGERFKKPVETESNWYHHVILLDDAGRVYDFDYGIEPKITPIEEYLEKMFLDEPECQQPRYGEFCGGRENKLGEYIFEAIDGESAIAGESKGIRRATLGEVLRNWKVLLP